MLEISSVDGRLHGCQTGLQPNRVLSASVPTGMPAFARLNEYDEPGDPETGVVRSVIEREYLDAGAMEDWPGPS